MMAEDLVATIKAILYGIDPMDDFGNLKDNISYKMFRFNSQITTTGKPPSEINFNPQFTTKISVTEANIVFGRFNPPHLGHKELVESADYVFVTHTQDTNNNPMNYRQKVKWLTTFFPEANVVRDYGKNIKHLEEAVEYVAAKGYKSCNLLVGSDRLEEMNESLDGFPIPVKVIQVGNKRLMNEAFSSEAMSSTRLREAVRNGDFITFSKMVPGKYALKMWEDLKDVIPANGQRADDVASLGADTDLVDPKSTVSRRRRAQKRFHMYSDSAAG